MDLNISLNDDDDDDDDDNDGDDDDDDDDDDLIISATTRFTLATEYNCSTTISYLQCLDIDLKK